MTQQTEQDVEERDEVFCMQFKCDSCPNKKECDEVENESEH